MRLLGAEFHGFKRLYDTSIRLDNPVVALVGPNEAGKSSILAALLSVENRDGLTKQELTRGTDMRPDQVVVRLVYALDDEDGAALADHHLDAKTHYVIEKRVDGSLHDRISPELQRDFAGRTALALEIYAYADTLQEDPDLRTAFYALGGGIDNEHRDLDPGDLQRIQEAADELVATRGKSRALGRRLAEFHDLESKPHPNDAALVDVRVRRPQFLLYGPEDRGLQSAYDMAQPPTEQGEALHLLARLGDLDLNRLHDAVNLGDTPAVHTLTADSAEVLTDKLRAAWRKTKLEVGLTTAGSWLHINVRDLEGHYVSLADRSEGLRSFLTLLAFVRSKPHVIRPVLLVDEADAHLHYDAQADLIELFETQALARAVIYTTHSPGALPNDLGTSLRAVRWISEDRSEIVDSIWRTEAGLSPILLALGAASAAFTPARQAVITEGPSDAVALPSLLREATGLAHLDYQMAPGLSISGALDIPKLELEAARVAYILDGDAAGSERAEWLTRQGIDPSRILSLAAVAEGITLEDLFLAAPYVDALNAEFEVWASGDRISIEDIPPTNRSAAVAAWCKSKGLSVPYKPLVAARVIGSASPDSPVLDPQYADRLVRLHQAIQNATGGTA